MVLFQSKACDGLCLCLKELQSFRKHNETKETDSSGLRQASTKCEEHYTAPQFSFILNSFLTSRFQSVLLLWLCLYSVPHSFSFFNISVFPLTWWPLTNFCLVSLDCHLTCQTFRSYSGPHLIAQICSSDKHIDNLVLSYYSTHPPH